jgi:hypothetical protein
MFKCYLNLYFVSLLPPQNIASLNHNCPNTLQYSFITKEDFAFKSSFSYTFVKYLFILLIKDTFILISDFKVKGVSHYKGTQA